MPQVADLAALQDCDDTLARLNGELAEAREELADSSALGAARAATAGADERCATLDREQRRLEGEIDALSAKIEHEDTRLYDGSARLPKELTGIQQEIESLKARRSRLEDAEIEVLETLDAEEEERAQAHAALEREQGASREKEERLSAAIAATEREAAAMASERREHLARLTAALVAQYEDLRRRKGGVAVAHVRGGACTGCRVSVPPSARKRGLDPEAPAFCPNCERILVGV